MKYDVKVIIQEQYIENVHRTINIMLIFKPKNIFAKIFYHNWYQDFSIKNHFNSDEIELHSQMDFEKHKGIDKQTFINANQNNNIFLVYLNNCKLKIPLPKQTIDWLLGEGSGIVQENSMGYDAKNNLVFEIPFDDSLDEIAHQEFNIENYSCILKKEDMADIYPF